MKKYQRMHLIFIRQYIKQIMEYKVDFVVGVLGVFLTQGLNLLFLNVIFQHIPSLEGWAFQEIAFIYGFSLIPKGLDHLFFDNLWALGQRLVRKGEFDKYLLVLSILSFTSSLRPFRLMPWVNFWSVESY